VNDWLVKLSLAAVCTGLCAATPGCGSSENGTDSDSCVAGRSVECVGPNGCSGYQVCDASGAYESCSCTSMDADGGSSARDASPEGSSIAHVGTGGTGSGSKPDTATDAGTSTGGHQETTVMPDAGNPPAECQPTDMKDWSPPPYVPARSPQDVCTDAEIESFTSDCLLGTDCSSFEQGGPSAACGECLLPTALSESALGPVIELSPRPFYRWDANVAGCVELSGETECAASIQRARVCAQRSCSGSCDASAASFDDCVTAAQDTTCAEHAEAAVCIMDPLTAERCAASGFAELVLALGRVFCSGGAS
jgi:hypothetical protein